MIKRLLLLLVCFAHITLNPATSTEKLLIPTVAPHPAVILYDGRFPDVYEKGVENLDQIRPFFAKIEEFLRNVERLPSVKLIINIAKDLTPSLIFDNSTVAETGLVTLSVNRGLFTDFTVRQLEVAIALTIATYSPARKGPAGIELAPIDLARNMPANIFVEGGLAAAAVGILGLGIYKGENWVWPCVGTSTVLAGSIFFAERIRRNIIVHVPLLIFKHARSMLTESARKEISRNPNHYLPAIALLAQVVSYTVQENFFIEDIFNRIFKKFKTLISEEPENLPAPVRQ